MRRVVCLLLTAVLLGLLVTAVSADGTAVAALDTECVVENDGACVTTLRLTVDFAPGTQGFSIPIAPSAREVSCSLPYTLRSGDGCRLVTLTGTLSGRTELVVSYRVPENVTDDGTSQVFIVQLLYPAWTCSISSYQVTVRFPGSFDTLPAFTSGYYGDHIDNYMTITIDQGVVHAVLNPKQTLKDHEAMSMELRLPKDFFDLRFLAGKTVRVDRLLFLGLVLLTAVFWLAFLRNLPILPKRQAMPPEGSNPGELPFVLGAQDPDLALMTAHWASLGYLTLTRTRRGRVYLTRQMEMSNERRKYEGEIFQALFSRGDRCEVQSAEYLKARRVAAERTRQFWQHRIFDSRGGSPTLFRLLAMAAGFLLSVACFDLLVASKSWRWLAILPLAALGAAACRGVQAAGGLLLGRHRLRTGLTVVLSALFLLIVGRASGLTLLSVFNLLFQLAVGLLLRCGGRRTRTGAVLAAELLGFRQWLLKASPAQLKANLEADPQYFYRTLPYADALRADRALAEGLERVRVEPCDWLIWEGEPSRTVKSFYARYCNLMAALRNEQPAKARPASNQRQPVSTKTVLPRSTRSDRSGSPRREVRRTGGRMGGRE